MLDIQEVLAVLGCLVLFGDCQVFGSFAFDGHSVQKVEFDGSTGGTAAIMADRAV